MKGIYTVDNSGRLCLGKAFVGKTFSLSIDKNGSIHLIPGQFIPDQEAWLYRNEEAFTSVMTGVAQASRGEGKPLPFNLNEDEAWLNDDKDMENEIPAHIPARSTNKITRLKGKRPPKQKNIT